MRKFIVFLKYCKQLGLLSFTSYLFQRFVKQEKIIGIKVPNLTAKVLIRNNPSDIQIFTQIFVHQEYNVMIAEKVNVIIDCGANIGLASLFFLSKYPNAKIIAIEPEENNFKMLKQNLDKFSNVTCIKKGVWDKTVNLEIIDNGWGDAGFIIKEAQSISEKSVPAICIEEVINQFKLEKINILKIDIEGSEEQVILNSSKWIKKVDMIFCEIHENLKPGLTGKIELILKDDFNFTRIGEYHVFKHKSSII